MAFDLMSFNLQHATSNADAKAWLERNVPGVDVYCGQEQVSRTDELLDIPGFRVYAATAGELLAIKTLPILTRENVFAPHGMGAWFLSPELEVLQRGAGPAHMNMKMMHWVSVREKSTDRDVSIANLHLIPSVHYRERDVVSEAQVAAICRWVDMMPGRLIVVGDFNMPPGHPNLAPLRTRMRNHNDSNEPTHRNRIIDHVWTRGAIQIEDVDTGDPLVKDDHRPVTARNITLGAE